MGTTAPENTKEVRGVIRTAQGTIEVIEDTFYGDKKERRSLWPLLLLIVAAICVLTYPLAAMLPLVLLALWVGGSGR